MSAPTYSTKNYDNAAAKYQQLADKYTGVQGQKKAIEQGSQEAKSASEKAGQSAYNQAVTQGYSRAKAARKASEASAQAFQNSYGTGYQNASNSNNAKLTAYGGLMSGAAQKDANKYQSDSNRYSAALGAVGGTASGIAGAISDANLKDIKDSSGNSSERCNELLKRLRGEA